MTYSKPYETFVATHESSGYGLTADELHDGIATDAYDAVYIRTPNVRHLAVVGSAAAHGADSQTGRELVNGGAIGESVPAHVDISQTITGWVKNSDD